MSWAVGFDSRWGRDIGYGVPAVCDFPECHERLDRGLGCVCGGEPYGGEDGCGLYFCERHLLGDLCERCHEGQAPFSPSPDTDEWLRWKLSDESWAEWRRLNPAEVEHIEATVAGPERVSDDG